MMSNADLLAEITSDPLSMGYSAFVVSAPGRIADMLNAVGALRLNKRRMMSEMGVMDKYADGPLAADGVMKKLEACAQTSHPLAGVINRTLKFLARIEGIDIGAKNTLLQFDVLAATGVLTVDEAEKMKALSLAPCSRAEQLFGWGVVVTEAQVREALNGNN